jgi:V/A-type H+-transporting ATPase subunit E
MASGDDGKPAAGEQTVGTGESGVQALIDRLREEGVESGRSEAQRLIDEAKQEKRRILEEADREAQRRKDAAQQEIDAMKQAAHDALHQAARDTVVDLRQQMLEHFRADVRRLVSTEVREAEVIKHLILSVAARAGDELARRGPEHLEIVLPRDVPGIEGLSKAPEELEQDELMRLVTAITGDRLRDGLTFCIGDAQQQGIRVIARDRDVEFDLSEQAMAELILAHLQPRFRALLDGLVSGT